MLGSLGGRGEKMYKVGNWWCFPYGRGKRCQVALKIEEAASCVLCHVAFQEEPGDRAKCSGWQPFLSHAQQPCMAGGGRAGH